ncbi:universal stress protein [Geodermatophilus marinus]|uniref:universal stress protein n=1 Tax=Geodermatophilus sp. LHW52908 TaxID=2303986 RepID=UPI000E3E0054|nr:universal stress protein [Geodermatophilus sp. LHW52908]RFU19074.1 universal stress protein [Geodermatophilus sp. LHW52908]
MRAYRTVVVGTDGSASSLRAVHRAGALPGAVGARPVVGCAHRPPRVGRNGYRRAREVLGEDVHEVVAPGPAEDRERTDLLVAGNRGPGGLRGGVLGSGPAGPTRRSPVDVLVVRTTG